jgi:hypothetical protein
MAQTELLGLVALGEGPAIGGISPRAALALAPKIDDPRALVRAQVAGLFADDATVRALDEEAFVTIAGDGAHRVLTSRIVDGCGLTTDHWVVSRGADAVVLAGAAPSVVWPMVQQQVRRALRAMLAAV